MLGQIVYQAGARGRLRLEEGRILGLAVCRVTLDPEGYWGERRVEKAGKLLSRAGARRVLVPEGFDSWDRLARHRLRPVEPIPFLRFHAPFLVLAALERQGRTAADCAVALRGSRADRDMVQAAHALCPKVREVCISAPRGGEELGEELRWAFGVAVRPDYAGVAAAVRYDERAWDRGEVVLDLFGSDPKLGGVHVALKEYTGEGRDDLALLAALWEGGQIRGEDLEFT